MYRALLCHQVAMKPSLGPPMRGYRPEVEELSNSMKAVRVR